MIHSTIISANTHLPASAGVAGRLPLLPLFVCTRGLGLDHHTLTTYRIPRAVFRPHDTLQLLLPCEHASPHLVAAVREPESTLRRRC